jgi:hypothetical protein
VEYLEETGCGGVDRINLAQKDHWQTLVNAKINLRGPSNSRNFFTRSVTAGFSKGTVA